jgi:hypothetical protein
MEYCHFDVLCIMKQCVQLALNLFTVASYRPSPVLLPSAELLLARFLLQLTF